MDCMRIFDLKSKITKDSWKLHRSMYATTTISVIETLRTWIQYVIIIQALNDLCLTKDNEASRIIFEKTNIMEWGKLRKTYFIKLGDRASTFLGCCVCTEVASLTFINYVLPWRDSWVFACLHYFEAQGYMK